MNNSKMPIGVFDSGIGGLTVLKEILRSLPSEGTIYLGDTARVPYGTRSPETVTRYSFESTRFLIAKGVKLLVVACNTVSATSLEAIKGSVTIPVVGVIEPGARAAVGATANGRIGVIGTNATIRSNAYTRAIHGIDHRIEVFGLACPLFVPLVEEDWTGGRIVEMIAETYLKALKTSGIDTLVLGCTHYPLLKDVLSKVMGDRVTLIDSAVETAKEIGSILGRLDLLSDDAEAAHSYFVTDAPEKFIDIGERFLGNRLENIIKIELGSEA